MVIFAAVGAFTVNNNLFDVWTMLGFGILGRLAENSLRQSLMLSGRSVSILITRPISFLVVAAGILAYLTPLFRWAMKSLRSVKVNPA